jgi:hypothetical protein
MSIRIKIGLGIAVLAVMGGFFFLNTDKGNPGLRICPDELVIKSIAGPDRSGATEDTFLPDMTEGVDQSFYLINGEKKAVQEFDTAWVAENCKVPVTNQ